MGYFSKPLASAQLMMVQGQRGRGGGGGVGVGWSNLLMKSKSINTREDRDQMFLPGQSGCVGQNM